MPRPKVTEAVRVASRIRLGWCSDYPGVGIAVYIEMYDEHGVFAAGAIPAEKVKALLVEAEVVAT